MTAFYDDVREAAAETERAQKQKAEPSSSVNPPYDLDAWRIARFRGPPPPMNWLVQDVVPLGIAGAFYSVGGAGKSTLALDLAVRVAIAGSIPGQWLGAFPVERDGTVVYLSAEEPEDVLHRRLRGLTHEIAGQAGISEDEVFAAANENLYISDLWGRVEPLFVVKATSLEPSLEYGRVEDVLRRVAVVGRPLRLVIIDTRSRFSGAEGAGNALVSREVALYERLAHDTGATVLVLHHVNKSSTFNMGNHMAAARGESAFLDCLRFSIHMETLSAEAAAKNDIHEEERTDYLVITNSKQNYGKLKGPIVLRREGYRFTKTEIKARARKGEVKERQRAEDRERVLEVVRKSPGISQHDVIHALRAEVSHGRCRMALGDLVGDGVLKVESGSRGAKKYSLTEEGTVISAAPPL